MYTYYNVIKKIFYLVFFLSKTHNNSLIMRKAIYKLQ